MEDLLKRECIEHLVDRGLEESKTLLASIGVEFVPPDDIDKKVMIDKMFHVCAVSGKEIKLCEDFLTSDLYLNYVDSVRKMSEVIINYMSEEVKVH